MSAWLKGLSSSRVTAPAVLQFSADEQQKGEVVVVWMEYTRHVSLMALLCAFQCLHLGVPMVWVLLYNSIGPDDY